MIPKKTVQLAVKSPWTALACLGLIVKPHKNTITPRYLDQVIRKRYEKRIIEGANEFPRVGEFEIDGRSYYLRLYGANRMLNASRYLFAVKSLPSAGIRVPELVQKCFTVACGRRCFALLERKIEGSDIGHRVINEDATSNFGTSLSLWHNLPPRTYKNHVGLFRVVGQESYARGIQRRPLTGRRYDEEQRSLVKQAELITQKPETFTHIAPSHGDVNPHNIFLQGNDVTWIDLDTFCLRPVWYDLAAAMCKILIYSPPATIDLFEEAYFRGRPVLYEEWRNLRKDWLTLYSVQQGVDWFARNLKGREGAQVFSELDPNEQGYAWGLRAFKKARAIMECCDSHLSTGEIIAMAATYLADDGYTDLT